MAAEALATPGNKGWLYHPNFPDHWKRVPLYSMAKWVNGIAFRDIQFSVSGMPVIKIAEIKGGISEQTRLTQQTFDSSVRVSPGDLLFSWSGQPETSIDVYWWRGPEGWLNQHVFRVTPAAGIDPTFFYYLLRYLRPNFVGIARNKQTTGLGHVTKRDLENIEAAYPEFPDQRAIAHILGTLDDKIELNRRMNETLESMARALFKSWFVDFDPVRAAVERRDPGLPKLLANLFPGRFVHSELGEIPEGWRVGRFGDVVESLRDQENPLASPTTLFEHFSIPAFDEGRWPKCEPGSEIKSLKSRVPPGAVLLSKLNPEIDRVWLTDVKPKDRAVCSTEFLVLRPRTPFGRAFVYSMARSPVFRQQIEALVTGTSKSHQRAHTDAILGLPAVVPPRRCSEAFDRIGAPSLERTLVSRRESRVLAHLRDTLLPKLISGEVRVKDAEKFVERAV
jgi:type I restriction enzyme, S subunit